MAWILSLERAGLAPEVFVIEEVAPGSDWIEAEQFWISYFRMIGANLCNHTAGGEGQTGYKQPPEMISKRIRHGEQHHSKGKPQLPQVREALRVGGEKLRADPVRWKRACDARRDAFTEEMKAKRLARLRRANSNPEIRARANEAKRAKALAPEARAFVSKQSSELWRTKRAEIIAAQNAGKGEAWKRKQSTLGMARMQSLDHPLRVAAFARRKLSDEDVKAIRVRLANGEIGSALAREYNVSQPTISDVKTGRYRK